MSFNELTHKFVAVLNKKIPAPRLFNALGHIAVGLVGGSTNQQKMRFNDYSDKNGGKHRSISDLPFIVLQADNSNQLRTLRNNLLAAGIQFTDFTDTMIVGTYVEQHAKTQATPELELEYFGICAFGPMEILNPLVKKFSLLRE